MMVIVIVALVDQADAGLIKENHIIKLLTNIELNGYSATGHMHGEEELWQRPKIIRKEVGDGKNTQLIAKLEFMVVFLTPLIMEIVPKNLFLIHRMATMPKLLQKK